MNEIDKKLDDIMELTRKLKAECDVAEKAVTDARRLADFIFLRALEAKKYE